MSPHIRESPRTLLCAAGGHLCNALLHGSGVRDPERTGEGSVTRSLRIAFLATLNQKERDCSKDPGNLFSAGHYSEP